MHTVPAFHVAGSLALAICTISTNDGADFWGFCSSKPHNYSDWLKTVVLRLLGTPGTLFCPIVKPHSPNPMCAFFSCLDSWRGLKIVMPRLVTDSGVVKTVCPKRPLGPAAASATLFSPIHNLPTTNQKIREAGRFSLLTFDRIWKEKYNPK
jgi:hypothetical protein